VPTLKNIQIQFTAAEIPRVMREPTEIRGSYTWTSSDYAIPAAKECTSDRGFLHMKM